MVISNLYFILTSLDLREEKNLEGTRIFQDVRDLNTLNKRRAIFETDKK